LLYFPLQFALKSLHYTTSPPPVKSGKTLFVFFLSPSSVPRLPFSCMLRVCGIVVYLIRTQTPTGLSRSWFPVFTLIAFTPEIKNPRVLFLITDVVPFWSFSYVPLYPVTPPKFGFPFPSFPLLSSRFRCGQVYDAIPPRRSGIFSPPPFFWESLFCICSR